MPRIYKELTLQQELTIIELRRDSKLQVKEIARKLGAAISQIDRCLQKYQVVIRPKNATNKIPDELVNSVMELRSLGMTHKEIARKLGITEATSTKAIFRHGAKLKELSKFLAAKSLLQQEIKEAAAEMGASRPFKPGPLVWEY